MRSPMFEAHISALILNIRALESLMARQGGLAGCRPLAGRECGLALRQPLRRRPAHCQRLGPFRHGTFQEAIRRYASTGLCLSGVDEWKRWGGGGKDEEVGSMRLGRAVLLGVSLRKAVQPQTPPPLPDDLSLSLSLAFACAASFPWPAMQGRSSFSASLRRRVPF